MCHRLFSAATAVCILLFLSSAAGAADKPVLSLDAAIAEALAYSPELAASQSRAKAADAAKDEAGLLPNPEIGVTAENAMGNGAFNGFDNAELTYGVTQLVELPGKRGNRRQAAKESVFFAHEEARAAAMDVVQSVHIAYAEASIAETLAAIASEELALAKEAYSSVNAKVEAGKEPPLQAQKAKIAYTNSELESARSTRRLKAAQDKLQSLLGRSTDGVSLDTAFVTRLDAPQPQSEYEALLIAAPEARAAETDIRRAEAEVKLEKARMLPDPTFNLGLRDFRGSGDQAMVMGVSFPIPVFNRNSAAVEKAGSLLNGAKHDARSLQQRRQRDFAESYAAFTDAYYAARMLETDVLPTAREASSISRQSYDAGKLGYLEVLDAQRTLFDTQREWSAALLDYHIQKAAIERLTGFNHKNSTIKDAVK